jgi:hypothetical protein
MKRVVEEVFKVTKRKKMKFKTQEDISNKLVLEIFSLYLSQQEDSSHYWKFWAFLIMHLRTWDTNLKSIAMSEKTKFCEGKLFVHLWNKCYKKLVLWDIWERLYKKQPTGMITLVPGKYYTSKDGDYPGWDVFLYTVKRREGISGIKKKYTVITCLPMVIENFVFCPYANPYVTQSAALSRTIEPGWLSNRQATKRVQKLIDLEYQEHFNV